MSNTQQCRRKLTWGCEVIYRVTKQLKKLGLISNIKASRIVRICHYRSIHLGYPTKRQTRHRRILLRYQGFCERCGCHEKTKLTVDHIKPLSVGGKDTLGNKQLLCRPCHKTKTIRGNKKRRKQQLLCKTIQENN